MQRRAERRLYRSVEPERAIHLDLDLLEMPRIARLDDRCETGERATDQEVSCVCGCTEYLRLQKRMKRTDAMKQRKAELAVAAFVPPKAWGKS